MIERFEMFTLDSISKFYDLPIIRSRQVNDVLIELRKLPGTRTFYGLVNPPVTHKGPAEWYGMDGADIEPWWNLMKLRFS